MGQDIRINGADLHCELRGEGAPLLLLHGFGGAAVNWNLIFRTAPPGYRLVVPDLRGHGRSTNPSGSFSFRQNAEDILALLDYFQVPSVQTIGVSGGGQTLLHLAAFAPERISALVLVSTAPNFPPTARAFMEQSGPNGRSEEEWQMMRGWHKHGDDQIRALWTAMHLMKDDYSDVHFTSQELARIKARTLIVHGDRDPLYPSRIALEMHEAIPGSYLWVIPNGGHDVMFRIAPRFGEVVLAFLGGWKGASA